jgi:hypothetical protein
MRRKLILGLIVAGLFMAGFGAATFPALAELRVITITLQGGQEITTTVDVPSGTPVDQIKLPEITAPVTGVREKPKQQQKERQKEMSTPDPAGEDTSGGESGARRHEGIAKSEGKPEVQAEAPEAEKEKSKSGGAGDIRRADGVPTRANPTFSLGLPGPAPIGVPNFIISKFRIPPFLLPLYQAAGVQYGIRWEVLAAINEIETDYGRNLNVSSAGALGWMQFLPSSWKTYGVDANRDGERDPYNPVDAIFAAARYLKAAGGEHDIKRAIFAYNHADWYVDSVMMRARLISGIPADLVGSLTGLTQAHFPVHAKSRYADDLAEREVRNLGKKVRRAHNAAKLVNAVEGRRSINIYSRRKAPVIAVNDGVVRKVGVSERLGRFIVLQDVYGNRFTYAHLGDVSDRYPVPKEQAQSAVGPDDFRAARESRVPKPTAPASAGRQPADSDASGDRALKPAASSATEAAVAPEPRVNVEKERLFADPSRPRNRDVAAETGQLDQTGEGFEVFRVYFSRVFRLNPSEVRLKQLKKGSKVVAGTVLGHVGKLESGPGSKLAPHLNFSIRPAGRGAPRIDPKPIIDGWKLLEATAVYRAAGRNPFLGGGGDRPSIGQVLLMSKETLARRVLADPNIDIYPCGRDDIRTGIVDRRVLATLEFLSLSGLRPTVTSLKCGHSHYTASGNVSEHSSGNAVDIAKINGIPIQGNQEKDSVGEETVRRLLTLQGALQPHQIISLIDMGGPTLAASDHGDHIHVGFTPQYGVNAKLGRQARRLLSSNQWDKLVSRLGDIQNPIVRTEPSRYSIEVERQRRARNGHGD